ncbi:hypothetical protein J2S34_001813 [Nitrobacter winogradskyi]|uniref:Uncharacterized protein n=1 Tax=Nitrobacter winogradskyi TaxID=913 RepID=A0ACC6AK62_NITWI|nr:hypothetical protein [Nitrobacter winogradskyi]
MKQLHDRESGTPSRRATHRIAIAGATVFVPGVPTGGAR